MKPSTLPARLFSRNTRIKTLVLACSLLILASIHSRKAQSDPLFAAPFLSFDAGPFSVAIGDLNGDGKLDVATANGFATVSVLLGKGDGTLGGKVDYGTGGISSSVAIADLNADGKPDLAVANSYSGTVSILLGTGDGGFAAHVDYGTGGSASSVAVGDLNGDNELDLAVAGGNVVSVLLGNGDGTFGANTDFATGTYPNCVVIGDLSGDGHPDLVTSNLDPNVATVSVLLGNGDGSFGAKTDYGTGINPFAVVIGDLNADGKPDLATANEVGTTSVLLGNGDGSFAAKTDYGTGGGPQSLAIGDLNADGKLDLVTGNNAASTVSVLPGNGDGSFKTKIDSRTGSLPTSVVIGDLNADGKLDLVTANVGASVVPGPSTVSALLGNGDGTFGVNAEYGTGNLPNSVALGDLNGDGKADLVTANFDYQTSAYTSTVSVLLGNGDGSFGQKTDYTMGSGSGAVAIGDLNADGKADLVTASAVSNTASVLLGNGAGSFGTKTEYSTGAAPISVAIADLNGDGKPDLVTANNSASSISVLLGIGDGSFGTKADFATGQRPVSVAVSDLNSDGKMDIATANSRGTLAGSISILLGNGDGTFAVKTDYAMASSPTFLAIGDLNLDSKPDLVTTNMIPNMVSVLLGNGDGSFGATTEFATGRSPRSLAITDLNADGKLDVATANQGANTVSVLLGNGDGTLGAKTDYGAGDIPISIAIGDLNADGKPDLAIANNSSNTVSILLNLHSSGCVPTPIAFDLNPSTLSLSSRGRWLTATLEPDPPISPSDIDVASIRLNGTLQVDASVAPSIGDADSDGRPDLTVKFSRSALELTVAEGDVPVAITGQVGAGCFESSDVIKVVRGHVTAPAAGSVLEGGAITLVSWQNPSDGTIPYVTLLYSADGGATWSLVAQDLPNTGSYAWTVPARGTDRGRVAVVLAQPEGQSGYEVEGVVAVSDPFTVLSAVGVADPNVAFALHGSFPNPGRGLRVSFSLPNAEPAKLSAYDVAGRLVGARAVGVLGPGRHVVALRAPGTLPPGLYLIKLEQGARRLVTRAIVVE